MFAKFQELSFYPRILAAVYSRSHDPIHSAFSQMLCVLRQSLFWVLSRFDLSLAIELRMKYSTCSMYDPKSMFGFVQTQSARSSQR